MSVALSIAAFPDLARLRAAHLAMLERQAKGGAEQGSVDTVDVQAFRQQAAATGAVLSSPEERSAAQRIIDYWGADLLESARTDSPEAETLTLVPFVPPEADAASPPDPHGKTPEDARQYIRFVAIARQWREKKSTAYLLSGDALAKARQFERDPDIAELVRASDAASARWAWIKNGVIVVLALLSAVSVFLAWRASESAKTAKNEAAEVIAQMAERSRVETELRLALEKAAERTLALEQERKAGQDQSVELAARQRMIDIAIVALADQVARGAVGFEDLPEEIRPDVAANLAARMRQNELEILNFDPDIIVESGSDFELALSEMAGFQDGPFGPDLAPSVLPRLGPGRLDTAHAQGRPVDYLNYSLVLDGKRRFAIYAAANLDRSRRTVLPASKATFEPDPRLPPDVQPDPQWFQQGRTGQGLAIAELVGREDIAWGIGAEDAELVDRSVRLYPNAVPVSADLKAGWEVVSAWVQTGHNPTALQVVVLSGPLFDRSAPADAPPVALWKIAISVAEQPQKQALDMPALVVDAFLVTDSADLGKGRIDVERFRSTVAGIAARSGLIFPAEVLAADLDPAPELTRGDRLAAAVPGLDGPDAKDRIALADNLVALIGTEGIGSGTSASSVKRYQEDQAKVVTALIASLQNARGLSATGRLNVALVLAAVPKSSWDRPEWRSLRAAAIGAVIDLNAREALGDTEIVPQTRDHLDQLMASLKVEERQPQTVYLQFAEMTRDRAGNLRASLDRLGWKMPGEERVEAATGKREVRYNPSRPADRIAAEALAADISALGWTDAKAVPLGIIREGILEIWIGFP